MAIARLYEQVGEEQLSTLRQMLFFSGPRQVGKTWTAQALLRGASPGYYSWDNAEQRLKMAQGQSFLAQELSLESIVKEPIRRVAFDELHKWPIWKDFLKGFYDAYPAARCVVTGSARLNAFHATGDSLMGRYFVYRYHPLSVAELASTEIPNQQRLLREPRSIAREQQEALLRFGGFPEPFLYRSDRFATQWKTLRAEQLFQEDLRDLTRIHHMRMVQLLADFVAHQSGSLLSKASLAQKIGVSPSTITEWLEVLEAVFFVFRIPPWSKNVTRSVLKEPKVYLWDWSLVEDEGARKETLVACALLKAVDFWNDHGLGRFGLYFLRDRDGREVDFLVTRDDQPWFLVEVKNSFKGLSSALCHFHQQLNPQISLQIDWEHSFHEESCWEGNGPKRVSAWSFLSQLV
jgi:predicted AAA+ superfamily ATPase